MLLEELIFKFFVNFGGLAIAFILAKYFMVYLQTNYPFIGLSDKHYYAAMFVWCTMITTLDIILPYGKDSYDIYSFLNDLVMAGILTILNRLWEDKNF